MIGHWPNTRHAWISENFLLFRLVNALSALRCLEFHVFVVIETRWSVPSGLLVWILAWQIDESPFWPWLNSKWLVNYVLCFWGSDAFLMMSLCSCCLFFWDFRGSCESWSILPATQRWGAWKGGLSSSDTLSPGKEHLEDQGSFPQFNPWSRRDPICLSRGIPWFSM